jgi:hypothetical protein
VSNQVPHPYKTTVKIIVLYILIFIFLDSKLGGGSVPNPQVAHQHITLKKLWVKKVSAVSHINHFF